MNIEELHHKLQEAYTVENLNRISLTLIELYKNQQYSVLQKIAEIISDSVAIEISDDGKGFSKFMKLYHPDRLSLHLTEIDHLATHGNFDGLFGYSHILLLARVDEIASSLSSYEDIDYSPVYDWDFDAEGFSIIDDRDPEIRLRTFSVPCNFYDAVKKRIFEDTSMEFPAYYLEDLDEFELSSSDIDDLEGIEFCIHAITMDLSDNLISDLEPLFNFHF